MTEDFVPLLDPRAGEVPPSGRPAVAAGEDAVIGRGIPEVTRPKSRFALPAMILGATLVTGGLVYSVSSAGEIAPSSQTIAPPPPPPAPPLEPPELDERRAPLSAPLSGTALGSDSAAQTERASSALAQDRQRRRDEARQRAEDARRRAAERLRSPLIVTPDGPASAPSEASPVRLSLGGANGAYLGSASEAGVETARARVLPNQGALVAQGTLVPGVLETAINSDLPGLLRAVVAADVASFDGRQVLIPRGSRLIGQYRSGIAVGQTRAFVVWTRLITPAGVSIALGSPGTDALGQAGVTGRVDHHFFQRFGAALLLSVVGSGAQAAANAAGDGDDLTINAAGDASRVAELALQSSVNIPPTIKVRQGTPIRIFVAKDLDFSGTESAAIRSTTGG